jgi:nitrite reductase/ring-hydroxylating ferredoxin subunit
MTTSKIRWVLVTEAIALLPWQENNMCLIEVEGKKITLIKKENEIFATAHKCPHAGGVLADGYCDALGNIVCPLHRYKFNIENGRNTSGEGYYLKTYPLQIRENKEVFIGFEEKGFLNFFK